MTHAARDAGAYGAKLSGAGGGDCMIAVASNHKTLTVKKQLQCRRASIDVKQMQKE